MTAFELFLVSERIFKKESGEIAFDLISLFCFIYKYKSLQEVQLPWEHLFFMQNFIITKYLKQEIDVDLRVCVDERSLSITGDIKI